MSSIISSGQNRQGYAIDPQLKILSNFNPPVSKTIAPVASVFMDLMPKKIDNSDSSMLVSSVSQKVSDNCRLVSFT